MNICNCWSRFLFCLVLCSCFFSLSSQSQIKKHNGYAHLEVDGEPMLMIAGELGNSSASTRQDISRIFPHLAQLGLNTVLVPVSWELIEPSEGEFDMTLVADILDVAHANDLKVVLLWFGLWKNSMSCYAPEWVKKDIERFPRAHTASGKPVEEISSLSINAQDADLNAFTKLIEYLRDHDTQHTVVMIQVENEIGMIECPRDYSEDATAMYNAPVPNQLVDFLKENADTLHPYIKSKLKNLDYGLTWTEMFGDDIYTEEIFQTWTYAKYVQRLANSAKRLYELPMFVNVALNSRNRLPGQYPSGGPLAHLIDIWHCSAPDIDVLGVDIYDKGFADWCDKYHLPNNPLFIPEIRLEDRDAMYAIYAFGHHDAMGFSPFSIEDYPLYASHTANDWQSIDLSVDDQLNSYSSASSELSPLASCYRLLRGAEDLILSHQGSDDMDAVLLENAQREANIITPDSIRITVRHSLSLGWEPESYQEQWPEAACLVIRIASMEYLVIGSDVVLTFSPAESGAEWQVGDRRIGLIGCKEVGFKDGALTTLRYLNGDQTHQGRHVRIPHGKFSAQTFKLYEY